MSEKEEQLKPNKGAAQITTSPLPEGWNRIKVQFHIDYRGYPGKTPVGESKTEPDMHLTIGQLVERHARGASIPEKQPIYFDMEVPTFADLTDIERYREQLVKRKQDIDNFIKDEIAKKEAEKTPADQAAAKHAGDTSPSEKEAKTSKAESKPKDASAAQKANNDA